MLDLHLNVEQSLVVETPSGDVEVCILEIHPEIKETTIEVFVPEEWANQPNPAASYKLRDEFVVTAPDGPIRLKVLRFRPRPDGTGGAVSLGIDAPRDWPILR